MCVGGRMRNTRTHTQTHTTTESTHSTSFGCTPLRQAEAAASAAWDAPLHLPSSTSCPSEAATVALSRYSGGLAGLMSSTSAAASASRPPLRWYTARLVRASGTVGMSAGSAPRAPSPPRKTTRLCFMVSLLCSENPASSRACRGVVCARMCVRACVCESESSAAGGLCA